MQTPDQCGESCAAGFGALDDFPGAGTRGIVPVPLRETESHMNVYGLVLYAHSYLRWLVLLLLVLVMVRAFIGAARSDVWSEQDERLHAISVAMLDLQFTLGVLLYAFLSPWVRTFFADIGKGMKDSILRFYGVEHLLAMLIALALVHIGRVRSKRAGNSKLRQRRVAVSTLIALLIIFASIPWPGMRYGRQLLRGVGQTHHAVQPLS